MESLLAFHKSAAAPLDLNPGGDNDCNPESPQLHPFGGLVAIIPTVDMKAGRIQVTKTAQQPQLADQLCGYSFSDK